MSKIENSLNRGRRLPGTELAKTPISQRGRGRGRGIGEGFPSGSLEAAIETDEIEKRESVIGRKKRGVRSERSGAEVGNGGGNRGKSHGRGSGSGNGGLWM